MPRLFILCLFLITSFATIAQPSVCLDFSPYFKIGQDPRINSPIPSAQLVQGLEFLRPHCDCIRTFAAGAPLDSIAFLAKKMGFKTVVVGIWLDQDSLTNATEIDNAIRLVEAGVVDRIVVGSEAILRGDLTPEALIDYLLYVKSKTPNTPVTTADVHGVFLNHPEILEACDFVYYNTYPYWEGAHIDCSIYQFHQAYLAIKAIAGDKEIWVSETGHPTAGNTVGAAVPNLENAIYYLKNIRAWSNYHDVPVFIFEAFDEPWKHNSLNPQEAYWGVAKYLADMDKLVFKEGMEEVFTQPITIDTSLWTCQLIDNEVDSARITFTQIPVYGDQNGFLCGVVDGVRPCDYNLVLLIKVNQGWWIKPTFTERTTKLACDGRFCIDVVTGGFDRNATEYKLFLTPKGWDPPRIANARTLPDSFFTNAITHACITRTPFTYGGIGIEQATTFVRPGDTIETSVLVKDIKDVLYFQGSIQTNAFTEIRFLEIHSIYDNNLFDYQLLSQKAITFTYGSRTNTDLINIPDSTVLFKITSLISPEAKNCRLIYPRSDSLALEVIHSVNNIAQTVPMLPFGSASACPLVPLKVQLEGPTEIEVGQSVQVHVKANDFRSVFYLDLTVAVDEGLTISQLDSIYLPPGANFEITDHTKLRVWYEETEKIGGRTLSNQSTLFSFTIKATEQFEGCETVYFVEDSLSLQTIKIIQREQKEVSVAVDNLLEFCQALAQQQTAKNAFNIQLFPNPTDEQKRVTVDLQKSSQSDLLVQIMTIQGQLIMTKKIASTNRFTLDLPIPAGLYMLSITNTANKIVGLKKIVIP